MGILIGLLLIIMGAIVFPVAAFFWFNSRKNKVKASVLGVISYLSIVPIPIGIVVLVNDLIL